jgi:hypothetical protein
MDFTPQQQPQDHNEQGSPQPAQASSRPSLSQSMPEPQEYQPPKMDRNTKVILAVAGVGVLLAGAGLFWNMTRTPQRASAAPSAPATGFLTEQQKMMREAIQMARDAQELQRQRMEQMRQGMEGAYEDASVPTPPTPASGNPLSDPELGLGGKP